MNQNIWRHSSTFTLACLGVAVGFNSFWKFPQLLSENGGSLFLGCYLLCLIIIGLPVMMSETILGRHSRRDPVRAVKWLSQQAHASKFWLIQPWLGMVTALLILSCLSVIGSWSWYFGWQLLSGHVANISLNNSTQQFNHLMSATNIMFWCHSLLIFITATVVIKDANRGLANWFRYISPILLLLLLLLLNFAIQQGDVSQALQYLLSPNPDNFNYLSALKAMGLALFTLGIGMAVMMTFGAYMPDSNSIAKTALVVALIDFFIAISAAVISLSLLFAVELEPDASLAMVFISLPVAFGNLPGGQLYGVLFFLLISGIVISSAIALISPAVAWLKQTRFFNRRKAVISLSLVVWLIGIGCILSFSSWQDQQLLGTLNLFENIDLLTSTIFLPLCALLTALFVGWIIPVDRIRQEMHHEQDALFGFWYKLLRYVTTLAIAVILAWSIYSTLPLS